MVSRLFGAASARGRGFGRVLLGALMEHAAAERLRVMLDVVDDRGAAIKLYEQLGWQLVDERVADWEPPKIVRYLYASTYPRRRAPPARSGASDQGPRPSALTPAPAVDGVVGTVP